MDDLKELSFFVIKYKDFDRKSGNKGQTISTRDENGYKVDIDCVDKNKFDFSKVPIKQDVKFLVRHKVGYNKGENGYYNRYITIELVGYANDIELS